MILNARIDRKTGKNKLKYAEERTCYLLLAVPIIGFLVFVLYPYIWAARWSLFDYTGVVSKTQYVGGENQYTANASWQVNTSTGVSDNNKMTNLYPIV